MDLSSIPSILVPLFGPHRAGRFLSFMTKRLEGSALMVPEAASWGGKSRKANQLEKPLFGPDDLLFVTPRPQRSGRFASRFKRLFGVDRSRAVWHLIGTCDGRSPCTASALVTFALSSPRRKSLSPHCDLSSIVLSKLNHLLSSSQPVPDRSENAQCGGDLL